ncbi:hypothetical protein KTH93_11705 [Acinetobacter bereziniae]|uniref:hypothetical protein n=1 Tax=Acinetobacter bereziniae TaxID=106648 RepID=UPI0019028358|nr:hypothetical protein [Acinetobacter bereziniae]MBJ8476599.1 hypothetical protein [Acinetobacter bereziniae]MCU4436134.1 hypothetical protein [Acinetobacter bereziniae]
MTTAAELRTETEKLALDKAVKSVNDALANAPFGLEISQIMNNCRLSHKTTKKVLEMINAQNSNGVWSLDRQTQTDSKVEIKKPTENIKVKPMTSTKEIKKEPQVLKVPYSKRLYDLFIQHPQGISLEKALKILGGHRAQFDSEVSKLRKQHFPVRLVAVGNEKLYVPGINEKPENRSETKPLSNLLKPNVIAKPQDPVIPEVQNKILEFRGMVQQRMTITKEVVLNSEQIDKVLMDVFGLDTVNWTNKDGHVQVQLTQTEVA